MGVDVKDLPVAYQAQALKKWVEQERRKKRTPLPCPANGTPGGGRKYHNKPTERLTASGAVLRFDSQKEARRYDELAALERDGAIRELRMQADFTLQEAYTDGEGRRVRAIRYRADFTYRVPPARNWAIYADDPPGWNERLGLPWELVVEDVKSSATHTKEYIMKRKLMKERFSIDIQEV